MMYKLPGDPCTEIRILEIHKGEKGWYFTIHRNGKLLFMETVERENRQLTVSTGIQCLDNLRKESTNG